MEENFKDKVYELWSDKDVLEWLQSQGFSDIVSRFEPHFIDGSTLPYLNHELLEEMGISEEEVRNSILIKIEEEKTRGEVKRKRRNTEAQLKKITQQKSIAHRYDESKGNSTKEREEEEELNVDRYGFIIEEETEETEEIKKKIIAKENRRLKKWQKMTRDKKFDQIKNNPKFRKRLHKGIPDAWRLKIWKWMTIGEDGKSIEDIAKTYKEYLEKEIKFDDENQIDLDINRTLRNHEYFKQRYGKGQTRLFNILKAFASYVPSIGFCQGMATVAAFLLIYSEEETAFGIMTKFVSEKYKLTGLWEGGFPLLMETFFIHNRLFQFHLPRLWRHFSDQRIHASAYATRWYMTLFLCFSFQTSLRVWDIFLYEGYDSLLFFSIGILDYFQVELSKMDFEGILEFLGQLSKKVIDDDKLIEIQMKISHKTFGSMTGKSNAIIKLRETYQTSLKAGKMLEE